MQFVSKLLRKLRYSIFMIYANLRRWSYLRKQKSGQPIYFSLPNCTNIRILPEGQITELLYTSRFESRELALVSNYLKSGMNIIDIGANIGLYSILADKAINPGGKVWAFEPSSESYSRLLRNMSLNGVTSVLALKIALADKHGGNLVLKRDPGFRDGDRFLVMDSSIQSDVNQKGDSGDIEIVPVTTLDNYFYIQMETPPQFDFLKMDIEGGEFRVFRGAQKLLSQNTRLLMMFECTPQGCHRGGHTQEDVFMFLRGFGYELFCWNRSRQRWESNLEFLLTAGNVWACRDRILLPRMT